MQRYITLFHMKDRLSSSHPLKVHYRFQNGLSLPNRTNKIRLTFFAAVRTLCMAV